MFSATSCKVLNQIVNTPIDELTDFISKSGKNRFKNPSDNANLLAKADRASYSLNQIVYNGINIAIASSIFVIKCLEKEIKTLDEAKIITKNC